MQVLGRIVLMMLLVTAMLFPMATAAYASTSDTVHDLVYYMYQYLPR